VDGERSPSVEGKLLLSLFRGRRDWWRSWELSLSRTTAACTRCLPQLSIGGMPRVPTRPLERSETFRDKKNSREADWLDENSRLVCNNDDVLSARESFGVWKFCFVQPLHRVMISFSWRGLPLSSVMRIQTELRSGSRGTIMRRMRGRSSYSRAPAHRC
jgi:hypothetical protein